MARLRFVLKLAVFAALAPPFSPLLCGQEASPAIYTERLPKDGRGGNDKDGKRDKERDRDDRDFQDPRLIEIRVLIEKLPEDLRKKLVDKTRRWQQMPADEQAHFRFMQGEREKRAQKAVDDIIQTSGLKLEGPEKQKLADIYKCERRKLEQSLRDEMDQRRTTRLPELQKSVLEAYQNQTASGNSPTPSPLP